MEYKFNNYSCNEKINKELLVFCKKKIYTINGIYDEFNNMKKLEDIYNKLKVSITEIKIFNRESVNEFDITINYILDLIHKSDLMNSLFFLCQYSDSEEIDNNLSELCYCLELSSLIKDITFNLPTLLNNDIYLNQGSVHIIFGETISQLTIASLSSDIFIKLINNIKKLDDKEYTKLNNCIDLIINSLYIINQSYIQSDTEILFEKKTDKKLLLEQINVLKKKKTIEGFYNSQVISYLLSKKYDKKDFSELKYLFKLLANLVFYESDNYLIIIVKIINLSEKYDKLNLFMKCILNIFLKKIL